MRISFSSWPLFFSYLDTIRTNNDPGGFYAKNFFLLGLVLLTFVIGNGKLRHP